MSGRDLHRSLEKSRRTWSAFDVRVSAGTIKLAARISSSVPKSSPSYNSRQLLAERN
jgi:hypothetical protein